MTIIVVYSQQNSITMNPKEYKDVVYKIIGSAMKVHDELGWGLLEPIYNEALHLELLDQGWTMNGRNIYRASTSTISWRNTIRWI